MSETAASLAQLARNPLREKLARGELVASMTVRMSRGPEIGRIAAAAGFDSLYVDLEHSVLSLESTALVCTVAREAGVVPLVRVPALDAALIGRVLDAGAMGIIAPQIESAADARLAVACCRYPPRGQRSMATKLPLLHYRRFDTAQACEALDGSVFIAAMAETAAGLDSAAEIAAVEGVDMLLVGAQDLGASLGSPPGDEPIAAAFSRVLDAARAAGKHVGAGGIAGRTELLQRLIGQDVRYVSTGTDLAFLLAGARAARQSVGS
ncbi:HpcH/HpaI aldolase family protein [Xylophilus sp.]|uniref:HpcH/HpaI aldolase family protein n=1 Tax=Xylophilus sp. TaxID=2653893 RepID=UPI0013B5E943|nr:aldolase/citrate lyase family protein [Xylophilus sp.]KAF1043451.1 MAG: 2-dehydro-3,6-dideoxy-6-sulfogluconate aldolase [Xylophilus sp.]